MKRTYKQLFIVLGFTLTGGLLNAQNVVIDGEIRPRTEIEDGYKTPLVSSKDPGVFTSQRTRLGLTFTSGILTTQITVQDARVFGQYGIATDAATTNIYEAWADLLLIPGGSLKIGRQTIKYDDGRLFAAPTWTIKGKTHDMVLFKYSINDFQAHLGLAYNNTSEIASEQFYTPASGTGSNYRALGYLWLSTPKYKDFTLSGIVVDEALQDTLGLGGTSKYKLIDMCQTYTYGGNLKYDNADFPVSGLATAYFQAGKNVAGNTMAGKMFAIKVNYKATSYLTASVGTDYFSGDDNKATDGKISNFKKLYGADHSFNGYMDYWNTPLTVGLLDYYASVSAKVNKKLSLDGGFHVFNTQYKTSTYGKDLGSELDLQASYKLNTWTTVQAGYSRYFTNNNTLAAKGITGDINTPQWAYVMFTIKPTFLNTATASK
jgi:hypothetical protein